MIKADGINGDDSMSGWSAKDEENATRIRQRIKEASKNSAEKNNTSRMSSADEFETKSQSEVTSRVFTDFDVLAEIASHRDQFLTCVRKNLKSRGCDFATIGYIKSVIRNKPDLVIAALCSSSSVSCDMSSVGSQHTTFDEHEHKNISVIMETSHGSESESESQSDEVPRDNDSSVQMTDAVFEEARTEDDEEFSASSSSSYGETDNAVNGAPAVKCTSNISDSVYGLNADNLDDPKYMTLATAYFQLPFPAGGKTPIIVVEFNSPNDILVQRQDLNYNCEKMSISLSAWLVKNPGLWETFKCQSGCTSGTPVMFNPDGQWKRAVITSLPRNNCCNIRLVDHGTVHLDVPLDNLRRLSYGHAAHPTLISRVSLDISSNTEKSSDFNSMRARCMQEWKEAILECSGETNLQNYSIVDLVTREIGISLKNELTAYINGNPTISTENSVLARNTDETEILEEGERRVNSFTMPRVKKSTMAMQRNEGMGFPMLKKAVSSEIAGQDKLNTSSLEFGLRSVVNTSKNDLPPQLNPRSISGFPKLPKKTG